LVIERVTARKNKDWARADQVRAELIALGVSLEDTAEGTLWRL
jgi:cysteinyl-tRNA synthetase